MEELDEKMEEQEKIRYAEFKHKLNLEAAHGQIAKLEYSLTDATTDKATLKPSGLNWARCAFCPTT